MDHFREIKNVLTWHNEGKFNAELVNGVITKLNFCEPGMGPQDAGKCLTSTNYKYLQSVYTSLGELFAFIDEENKRLGYSYAKPAEMQHYQPEEMGEETYTIPSETKLRPVLNYEHPPELVDAITEKIESLTDLANQQQNIELSA